MNIFYALTHATAYLMGSACILFTYGIYTLLAHFGSPQAVNVSVCLAFVALCVAAAVISYHFHVNRRDLEEDRRRNRVQRAGTEMQPQPLQPQPQPQHQYLTTPSALASSEAATNYVELSGMGGGGSEYVSLPSSEDIEAQLPVVAAASADDIGTAIARVVLHEDIRNLLNILLARCSAEAFTSCTVVQHDEKCTSIRLVPAHPSLLFIPPTRESVLDSTKPRTGSLIIIGGLYDETRNTVSACEVVITQDSSKKNRVEFDQGVSTLSRIPDAYANLPGVSGPLVSGCVESLEIKKKNSILQISAAGMSQPISQATEALREQWGKRTHDLSAQISNCLQFFDALDAPGVIEQTWWSSS